MSLLMASAADAQQVDWTRTASTLSMLNAQILDWNADYVRLSAEPSVETLSAVLRLHFRRGPVVASGLKALLDEWKRRTAETQKQSIYLAVSRYFASHLDDWGSSVAWRWYDCFSPPLDGRYNALAQRFGRSEIPVAQTPSVPDALRRPLLEATLPDITAFLSAWSYPVVDAPLTRFGFDRGIMLDGRPPRDRALLNTDFTYAGTLVDLFGSGF